MIEENVIFSGSGSNSAKVLMWDEISKDSDPIIVNKFPKKYSVYALAFSPDGKKLAAGTRAGLIHIYSLSNYRAGHNSKPIFEIFHQAPVVCLTFCTENILVSGGLDGQIKIWSVNDCQKKDEFNAHQDGVFALCSISSNVFVSIGGDGVLRIWNMNTLDKIFESSVFILPEKSALISLEYSLKTGLLMHPSRTGELHIYDVTKGFSKKIIQAHQGDFCALACGSKNIITGGWLDARLKLWSLKLDKLVAEASTTTSITALAWEGTNNIMTVFSNGEGQIWSTDRNLSPGRQIIGFDLRVCKGLPEQLVEKYQAERERKWRDEMMREANELLGCTSPEEQKKFGEIVSALKSRGFEIETLLILADHSRAQGRLLWELETRLELNTVFGDGEYAAPNIYALAVLLEKIKEPNLACEYFKKIQNIHPKYSDIEERLRILENNPLMSFATVNGIRGDFIQKDHVLQELEKCTILKKKFLWKVLLDRIVIYFKRSFPVDIQIDAQEAYKFITRKLTDRGVDVTLGNLESVILYTGEELRNIQWVYIPSATVKHGIAYALEVQHTIVRTLFIPYAIFDVGLLNIAESISSEEHNKQVKNDWIKLITSSEAKQWLVDINGLVIKSVEDLYSKKKAQEEDEF